MGRFDVKTSRKKTQSEHLPFTKTNYRILLIGLIVIALGYYALGQEPWDGTIPLVVAPILLVLGYCVIIPIGILFRKKQEAEAAQMPAEPPRSQ